VHPYSTDESRVPVYGGLAVLAVVLAMLVSAALSPFSWPQWLVSAPSLAATFALSVAWFDRVAWRWTLVRQLGVVQVPNLAGRYEGKLTSTFEDDDGAQVEREVVIQVRQSWTRIAVDMTIRSGTSTSTSVSALAGIRGDHESVSLTYIYRNKVNPGIADSDMGDHDGAAELTIDSAGVAAGRYFNSRPRAGTLSLKRVAT